MAQVNIAFMLSFYWKEENILIHGRTAWMSMICEQQQPKK